MGMSRADSSSSDVRDEAFPAWRGNLLIGALDGMHRNRLQRKDGKVVDEQRLLIHNPRRARFLDPSRKGCLYVGMDDGDILRLRPAKAAGR